MISGERKSELMCQLEHSINHYLDRQWVVSDTILSIAGDREETDFMNNLNYYFVVLLPEDKQMKGEQVYPFVERSDYSLPAWILTEKI